MRRKSFPHGFYHFQQNGIRKDGAVIVAEVTVANYETDDDGMTFQMHVSVETGKIEAMTRLFPSGYRAVRPCTNDWDKFFPVVEAAIADHRSRVEQAKLFPIAIDWAGHAFVQARPRSGSWTDYDGTTGFRREHSGEFRPCMIRGVEAGQRIYVIGSQYSYDVADFEIQREPWMVPFVASAA